MYFKKRNSTQLSSIYLWSNGRGLNFTRREHVEVSYERQYWAKKLKQGSSLNHREKL